MDHADIAASTVLVNGPVTALHVRIPFSGGSHGSDSRRSTQQSIAKPTLPRPVQLASAEHWIPDSQVAVCMAPECQLQFSLFNRKHHCRVCGRIFCANCSSHVVPVAAAASTTEGPPSGSVRVCSECFYEQQLVVAKRPSLMSDAGGGSRRRMRGELKLFQWPLIVQVLSYLPFHDLLTVSAVSSDFYFISRDNVLWVDRNVSRWGANANNRHPSSSTLERPQPQPLQPTVAAPAATVAAHTASIKPLSSTIITHHARYNFTQFLDFARQLEAARCHGVSSFTANAKQLFSAPLKVCVVGPAGVGKTHLVKRFVGELVPPSGIHSTCGFATYSKTVSLVGGLSCDAALTIVDVAGDKRYDAVRALCAPSCHAVVACYDVHSKMSLVQTATMLSSLEPFLGPQPVVVCGIVVDEQRKREVSATGAEGISVRCRASIQTALPEEVFETVVQAVLDRLVGTASPTSSSSPMVGSPLGGGGARFAAQEMLDVTTNPSVLDVLLDTK